MKVIRNILTGDYGSKLLALFMLGYFSTYIICPYLQAGSWSADQSIRHDGLNRRFIYFAPDDLPDNAPVVFWLHIGGSNCWEIKEADAGGRKDFQAMAEQEKFLLIAPNACAPGGGDPAGRSQHWNDCRAEAPLVETYEDDVGFIAALIDWADANFSINTGRIYATGLSNGGMMAYRLALELADRIASVAVFCANNSMTSECAPMNKPVPVFICNGQGEDQYMPWNGGCVNSMECARDKVVSAIATRDGWIAYNNCDTVPASTDEYEDINRADQCTVTSELFEDGESGIAVKFYTVINGGHTIPTINYPYPANVLDELAFGNQNQDIVGAQHAWDFMEQFELKTDAEEPEEPEEPVEPPPVPPEENDQEQKPEENPVEQKSSGGGGGGCMLMNVVPAPAR